MPVSHPAHDHHACPHTYHHKPTQVKAGTIFDNILVCDDPDFAKAEAEKNIVPMQTKEKEMKKKADDEESDKRRKEEVNFVPSPLRRFSASSLPPFAPSLSPPHPASSLSCRHVRVSVGCMGRGAWGG